MDEACGSRDGEDLRGVRFVDFDASRCFCVVINSTFYSDLYIANEVSLVGRVSLSKDPRRNGPSQKKEYLSQKPT